MSIQIATHNGPFHADDVMAVALLRSYLDSGATVVRTRDNALIDSSDLVVDVGGRYEPDQGRFDHHQAAYTGTWSAAGMVLEWLKDTQKIDAVLAKSLRNSVMDYLDDVDNGRRAPTTGVPCFPIIVDALNQPCDTQEEFDLAFETAVPIAQALLTGLHSAHVKLARARTVVQAAMKAAAAAGRGVLFLNEYINWKRAYFEAGGEHHPTAYVLFPGMDQSWRIIAIPPRHGSFDQKVSLPSAWAGLSDDALTKVTGIEGSVFCHKNRFIAVFKTREGAITALKQADLFNPWHP